MKASPAGLSVDEAVRTGFEAVTSRCVRPTYRAELIREGQPVLLWVSGRDPRHPAGIYAVGHTTGPVARGEELAMPVRLQRLDPVVAREEIVADPTLASLEVIRMPAGSNPSYLDREQYAALLAAFPQVSPR
ncbi:MAG: hypothetical protein ABWX73_10655 [Marmoricola sp.]